MYSNVTDFGVVGRLTTTLWQIYCWVCFERICKIAQHLAKIWGKLIALSALCWCNVTMSTISHLWLADWSHQWLNVHCVRGRFVATSFFLIDGCAYSRSFCGFFHVVTVNIFSLVNKIMLTSLREYFW